MTSQGVGGEFFKNCTFVGWKAVQKCYLYNLARNNKTYSCIIHPGDKIQYQKEQHWLWDDVAYNKCRIQDKAHNARQNIMGKCGICTPSTWSKTASSEPWQSTHSTPKCERDQQHTKINNSLRKWHCGSTIQVSTIPQTDLDAAANLLPLVFLQDFQLNTSVWNSVEWTNLTKEI